ncbi:MAG: hypothetical protein EAZ30_09665 [Betaproteobacteria bacterium]|nr:MAG: hypothetical protein EAZ30_09665 [Betaproteobacteria bacterium]
MAIKIVIRKASFFCVGARRIANPIGQDMGQLLQPVYDSLSCGFEFLLGLYSSFSYCRFDVRPA